LPENPPQALSSQTDHSIAHFRVLYNGSGPTRRFSNSLGKAQGNHI
jgi:hypothetical protein